MTGALQVKCSARTTQGNPCKKWAVKGTNVCLAHGAAAPQVRNKANVVAEAMAWGFTDKTLDPGEVLLRLLTQSSMRAQRYAQELEELVEESPSLREALVADVWVQPDHGDAYKAGEYIRGLAQLEAQERDRCANFATKAIAAGLNERMVRVAEQQGQMLAAIVMKALADPDLPPLPPGAAEALKAAIARQVRELGS